MAEKQERIKNPYPAPLVMPIKERIKAGSLGHSAALPSDPEALQDRVEVEDELVTEIAEEQ